MSKATFPRTLDGQLMSCPEVMRATGLSRYDILKAFEANPAIDTLEGLRAEVVARKSRPSRGKPVPNRRSLLWNGMDRHRNRLNKTRTR